MITSRRGRLLAIGASAAIAVGAIGAGVAAAQDITGDDRPAAEHRGGHPHAHRLTGGLMGSIVEHSGLDRSTFREGFAEGQSITATLEEHGIDPVAIQEAALADLQAKLDELVRAGKIEQSVADRVYGAAEKHLPTLMNRVPGPDHDRRPGHRLPQPARGFIAAAVEVLGMEPMELLDELRDGATIAGIANEKGVPLEDVIAAVAADAAEHIDEAVARGMLDEERAEELKSQMNDRIERWITEGRHRHE